MVEKFEVFCVVLKIVVFDDWGQFKMVQYIFYENITGRQFFKKNVSFLSMKQKFAELPYLYSLESLV